MEALEARANHAESDSDLHGFTVASRVYNNPEIAKAFLYARALNKHVEAHDTALYLDAGLHGKPLPRELDALQATEDVFTQLDVYQRVHADKGTASADSLDDPTQDPADALSKLFADLTVKNAKVQDAIDLQHLVADHPDMFSDLAKHRAQLFIDAVKYFYPAQFAKQSTTVSINAAPAKSPVLHFTF